jgi:hypothetical protein
MEIREEGEEEKKKERKLKSE